MMRKLEWWMVVGVMMVVAARDGRTQGAADGAAIVAEEMAIEDVLSTDLNPAPAPVAAPVAEAPAEAPPAETTPVPVAAEAPTAPAVSLDDLLGDAPAAPVQPVVEVAAPAADAPLAVESVAAAPVSAPAVEAVAVAPVAVEAPAAVETRKPESVLILEDSEIIRRRAHQSHAEDSLREGNALLKQGKYQEAARLFEETRQALGRVGDIPGNDALRRQAGRGLAEAFYLRAEVLRKQADYENALKLANSAIENGHPKGGELRGRIERDMVKPPEPPKPKALVRWKQQEYKLTREQIADKLRKGKERYVAGEYAEAQSLFEDVLVADPENSEAIRLIHKLGQKRYDKSSANLEATRSDMMADLRAKWNTRSFDQYDFAAPEPGKKGGGDGPNQQESDRLAVERKMEEIKIPEIDFHQANIYDVIDFLQQASREGDEKEGDPEKKGVNLILNLSQDTAPAAPTAPADPFAPATPAVGASGDVPLITFSARYVSLLQALKIVMQVANLKYRIDGRVVMVVPINRADDVIIHRMYNVLPSLGERIKGLSGGDAAQPDLNAGGVLGMGGGGVGEVRADFKDFFQQLGVQWPDKSSIKYIPQISKLVVANTSENLIVLEKVLAVLDVVPTQIEIESRFVEIKQTDLDSLGFEWLLTDNFEIAQKAGQGNLPLNARQRVQLNANSANGGLTQGNRFLRSGVAGVSTASGLKDEILSFSSILTNPEMTMILHAMQQRGSADLLSAPKVTTQSGTEATIKVVTEYIYPTEFTVTPITARSASGADTIVGGVVEPSGFETREVGVILSVLPEVSPETQMINLTMNPQVVDEPEWREYGSRYVDDQGREQVLNMEQPFFKTRTISTSIAIYNGATVVMGGMINELRNKVDDKVPVLGDIPLIGRLFRSRYDHSEKRNLLIFVTARLVDPAGKPVRQRSDILEAMPAAAPVATMAQPLPSAP